MQWFPSLPRLTLTVWLGWLGLLGLISGMLFFRVRHPHFLPMTVLLAVVVVAGLALVWGGIWRIIRGPDRGRAATCLLLGTAPLLFMAGHVIYGVEIGYGRNTPLNLPMKMLIPLGESVMDLEARFCYPQRTAGEKVVMIATPVANAREQVAAMDRHVRALEARIGRTTTGRIHWVRGPLLGLRGHALFGLCMGSEPGSSAADAEGLASVDRHEVAHCVLSSRCSVGVDTPALLIEGWAEANAGQDTENT